MDVMSRKDAALFFCSVPCSRFKMIEKIADIEYVLFDMDGTWITPSARSLCLPETQA